MCVGFELAKPEDAEILMRLQTSAFEEDIKRYGEGPSGLDSIEWQYSSMNDHIYYKILYNEKIVGGVVVRIKGEGHYYIYRIFIDTPFQNLGIGSKTLEFLENTYRNAKKWALDTPYLNFRNHHFYEKMGYIKIGETEPEKESGFYLFLYEKIS